MWPLGATLGWLQCPCNVFIIYFLFFLTFLHQKMFQFLIIYLYRQIRQIDKTDRQTLFLFYPQSHLLLQELLISFIREWYSENKIQIIGVLITIKVLLLLGPLCTIFTQQYSLEITLYPITFFNSWMVPHHVKMFQYIQLHFYM